MVPATEISTVSLREVFADLRGSDRALRVTAHPNRDLAVLSIWRDDHCVATVQLAAAELPGLINALVVGLAEMAPLEQGVAGQGVAGHGVAGHGVAEHGVAEHGQSA